MTKAVTLCLMALALAGCNDSKKSQDVPGPVAVPPAQTQGNTNGNDTCPYGVDAQTMKCRAPRDER